MAQSIFSLDLADASRVIAARKRRSIELRVSFDIAGVDADDDHFAQFRPHGVWLGSIAIAIDGEVIGAVDVSGSGIKPDTIVAHTSPAGFGEGGG
jgi:hypothetical protein